MLGRVPLTRNRYARQGIIDGRNIIPGELDIGRADILFDAVQLGRARDGNDPWLLREHPGQRELRGRDFPFSGRCR